MLRHTPTILILLCASMVSNASGRTWRVDVAGTGDAPTIQAAIDSAQAGDDVLLAPGAYTWSAQPGDVVAMLRIAKPGITLHSEAGPELTIVDAQTRARVLYCSDTGLSTRIEGFDAPERQR